MFPEGAERVRAIALYTTVSAAGGAVGLVAGGVLTELVSWRWVMFVNVPIGLAILLLGRIVIHETEPRHGRFDLRRGRHLDARDDRDRLRLGGGGRRRMDEPLALGSFALGAVMLGLFVGTETGADEPILPLRLFASPTRTTANVARGLVYAGMYGMFFFLSQYLQDVQGYSPLTAGLAFLPIPRPVFLSSQLTSRVLVGRVPAKVLMMAGSGLATLSLAARDPVDAGTSYGQVVDPRWCCSGPDRASPSSASPPPRCPTSPRRTPARPPA